MVDTMGSQTRHPEEPAILKEARAYLDTADPTLLRRFGFEGALEDVLINGITPTSVVGKVVAASRNELQHLRPGALLAGVRLLHPPARRGLQQGMADPGRELPPP
jgi:hypothetical protein